jgi:SAM-dependent methyltransferase
MRKDYTPARADGADESAFVAAYWTQVWDAHRHESRRGAITATEEWRLMAPYLARLPRGARVLDGGCGLGEFVVELSRQGFDAVGMDISASTVERLRERFPGVGFMDGDIRATGLPDASVDLYFSWGVFEHFESGPGACLAEAYRLLKPGGHLLISVPFDNVRQSLRGALERPRPAPGLRFYQWRFTRAELARELVQNGFTVAGLHPISKREGVARALHHDFGLPDSWLLTKVLRRGLAPFVPAGLVAHMLLAVGRKPD